MTEKEIRKILKGRFADPNDRKYWEDRLKEERIKTERGKENEAFYRQYERGVAAFAEMKRKKRKR